MSTDAAPTSGTSTPPQTWPALDSRECRALGVLVEKAKTTPDAYPLSINALVTGCNQKSNRDPVTNYDDIDVEQTLAGLQKRGFVQKVVGGRVERWRHVLYETWHVNKVELAVLAELLLRGPQTEGELRGRASRMEPIDDLEALRPILRSLAGRGLVVFLGEEGRRGTMLAHSFYPPAELERLRTNTPAPRLDAEALPAPPPASPPAPDQLAELRAEMDAMRISLTQLQGQVVALMEQFRALQKELGG
jgi:uncharacterized protein YceH (UPF0502 family)